MDYTVYSLEDPRYHEIRLVGYCSDMYEECRRLYGMIDLSDEISEWLNDLYDDGYCPIIHILDNGVEGEAAAIRIKKYWTVHYHYVAERDLPSVPVQDRKRPIRRQHETDKLRRIREYTR